MLEAEQTAPSVVVEELPRLPPVPVSEVVGGTLLEELELLLEELELLLPELDEDPDEVGVVSKTPPSSLQAAKSKAETASSSTRRNRTPMTEPPLDSLEGSYPAGVPSAAGGP
jgi:hypothetical protein